MPRISRLAAAVAFGLLVPGTAAAAELDGADLGYIWSLPFLAVLMSIATGPLLFPKLWHHHYGKIVGGWALLTLAGLAVVFGVEVSLAAFVHAMLAEYMSFILLLFALYTVAGGILVTGNVHGTPLSNTAMIALGTVMASFVGTTGAAMILIRPLLRANDERPFNAHVVIFFIFLVANIGGSLTPLGDPPLFVGFLRGVDFFWTMEHLIVDTAFVAGVLIVAFFLVDLWFFRREKPYRVQSDPTPPAPFRVTGFLNIGLILCIIGAILLSAEWDPGVSFDIYGTSVALQNLVRDALFVAIALLSLWLTHEEHRAKNGFTWEPIKEVAKLFAAIFVTIIPVLAMLHAGKASIFAPLLTFVSRADGSADPVAYFWLTGMLSAFLDNAPTYLVFFELAGGDPVELMGPLAHVLTAISMGAVYMGALTYIGNAPNFMVYAIAVERGVKMPSFFGYMAWSFVCLIPLFVALTFLAIHG